MRLFFTYKDIFEDDICKIKWTDLIEHAIDLVPGAIPRRAKLSLWSTNERKFADELIPWMEEAGLIDHFDGPWGRRAKFPMRCPSKPEKGPRMVHNFIPVNSYTVSSASPCKRIDQIVHTVVQPNFTHYFSTDASNVYWAIPLWAGDEGKTGYLTPDGQYCYMVMGQGLKTAVNMYSRFRDITFGSILGGYTKTGEYLQGFKSIIGDHMMVAFDGLIHDSYLRAEFLEAMFDFLESSFLL
jgi:hypothetical protein